MTDKKTVRAAFGDWYRTRKGVDLNPAGPDQIVADAFEAGCKWLTKHSGQGGADIYTMTADQLRARLLAALESEERAHAKICELEDRLSAMETA